MLATTAVCLLLSQTRKALNSPQLITFPRSLHLGWVTAAALVNVNAYVGTVSGLSARTVLAIAQLSVVVAAAAGVGLSLVARLPLSSAAIGWALVALSRGTPVGSAAEALGPGALASLAQAELLAAALVLTTAVSTVIATRIPGLKK
jgi:hypothetical protein